MSASRSRKWSRRRSPTTRASSRRTSERTTTSCGKWRRADPMKEILKTHDTFPKLLVRNAETFGDRKVAMREKEFGIWQEFSWKEYHDHVKYFSLGLVSLGLQAGDKVAVIGDNRPEWVWGEVAAQAAGAVPLGRSQDSTLTEGSELIA